MINNTEEFIKEESLIDRTFYILDYLGLFRDYTYSKYDLKDKLHDLLLNIDYVESLIKYIEKKMKYCKNTELKVNMKDLVVKLNFLKQYLEKELDNCGELSYNYGNLK